MATYLMICDRPGCGIERDVRCPMDLRNEKHPCKEAGQFTKKEKAAGGIAEKCDGTGCFKRGPGLELTAFSPYAWSP